MNNVIAKEVFKEVKEILDILKINFFLIYGTCLGAVRDGDFIKGDNGIDLGAYHDNLIKKINPLREALRKKGFKVLGFSYPYYYTRALNFEKYDILFNLRNVDFTHNEAFIQKISSDREDIAFVWPKEFFEELNEIEFLGMKVKIPSSGYLVETYGDWTQPRNEHSCLVEKKGYWKSLGRTTFINDRELV